MTVFDQQAKAMHLKGGNYYDDMRIDISESHQSLAKLSKNPKSIKRPKYRNIIRLYLTGMFMKIGFYEILVENGISRKWLDDFRGYWSNILNGRPFWNTLDFFNLTHDYRKRQQHTAQFYWNDASQHIKNWQDPSQMYATFHLARKLASRPIVTLKLWRKISKGAHILEYGCSLAPYYYCYRKFFSHLNCKWTLADIPNFPFHYAKYLYRNDLEAEFVTIKSEDFSNPLAEKKDFDVIILITVLEHLDNPLFVSKYLLDRLKPGGLFVFDYIKSDGIGLDHPNAVDMREDCIKLILGKTEILYGKINDINENIGLCIAKKK
jgi:SAM-dependent methyltransferase